MENIQFISFSEPLQLVFAILMSVALILVGVFCYFAVTNRWKMMDNDNKVIINNDEKAKELALEVIEKAQKSIVMYDNGNKFPMSLYEDERIANSLLDKLDNIEDFRVEIFFNESVNLLVTKKIQEWRRTQKNESDRKRADVRIFSGKNPPQDIHFKIADSGYAAYLSSHNPNNEEDRKGQRYNVPDFLRNRLVEKVLGDSRQSKVKDCLTEKKENGSCYISCFSS